MALPSPVVVSSSSRNENLWAPLSLIQLTRSSLCSYYSCCVVHGYNDHVISRRQHFKPSHPYHGILSCASSLVFPEPSGRRQLDGTHVPFKFVCLICLFVWYFYFSFLFYFIIFETGFLCVTVLAALELVCRLLH